MAWADIKVQTNFASFLKINIISRPETKTVPVPERDRPATADSTERSRPGPGHVKEQQVTLIRSPVV